MNKINKKELVKMVERLSSNNEQLTKQLEEWQNYSKKEKEVEIKYIVVNEQDDNKLRHIKNRIKYEKNQKIRDAHIKELERLENLSQ